MATMGALGLLFGAGPASARPTVPSPKTPFAAIPAHLKTTTTTEQAPVRPLLIFQMGEGGSAAEIDTIWIDGVAHREARVYLARRLLKRYTKKYGNKIQWSMYIDSRHVHKTHVENCVYWSFFKWHDGCAESNPLIKKMFDHWNSKYGKNLSDFKHISNVRIDPQWLEEGSRINRSTGVWGDHDEFIKALDSMVANSRRPFRPLSLNYVVQPPLLLKQNIRYRCQPAFYVVVDDGLQYGSMSSAMNENSENALYGVVELAKYGVMPYDWEKIQFKKFLDNIKKDNYYYQVTNYDYACMSLFGNEQQRHSKKWIDYDPPEDGSCGMRFFSKSLASRDLMRDEDQPAGRKTDDAGKSWDDPAFPVQALETFSIRINNKDDSDYDIGSTNNNNAQAYFRMKGIASRNEYFYDVQTGEQFKNAFDDIISTVASSIQYGKVQSFSTVSPALGAPEATPVPGSAANVRLNMFDGASEIRIHEVTASNDPERFKYLEDDKDNLAGVDAAATYDIKIDLSTYRRPVFSERFPVFEWRGKGYDMGSIVGTGMRNKDLHIDRTWTDEWRDGLLTWLARLDSDAKIKNNQDFLLNYRERKEVDGFDNRSMGDIIDTPVLDIGRYMTTAANDGMVYVFKKTADGGKLFSLKLNWLPMDAPRETKDDRLMDHYHLLPDPEYSQSPNKPHQFMINGGMVWRLTAPNAKENRNLIVAGTYGQGGRGAYVMRVAGNELLSGARVGIEAPQSEWKDKVRLFTVDANKEDELGYTFGDPQIGNVVDSRMAEKNDKGRFVSKFSGDEYRYALFLSSGFNNPDDGIRETESALYVYNIFGYGFGGEHVVKRDDPGKRIAKIVANKKGGGLAPATLVDLDNDGIVDLAYAGDYNGGLYRFDFRNGMSKPAAVKIFEAGQGQRFTSAPGVMKVTGKDPDTKKTEFTGEVMVVIGTGSDIYESDAEDKSLNAVYGIRDDANVANPAKVLTVRDLQRQTFDSGGLRNDKRGIPVETRVGSANVNPDANGWYMNLSEDTGERVVTKPLIYDGLALVTTRMYDSHSETISTNTNHGKEDPCVAKESTQKFTGSGWTMQFDALTGARPKDFDYRSGESQAAYVDFMGHLTEKDKPIVSGVMEPGSGIPNLSMSGDKSVLDNLGFLKDEPYDKPLQMDANFDGDVGGSGVSGEIPKLSKLDKNDERNYNLFEMKYDRDKIVPALFVSTSVKGLQPPYTLAMKKVFEKKTPPEPAGQTQILKRLSFKVVD